MNELEIIRDLLFMKKGQTLNVKVLNTLDKSFEGEYKVVEYADGKVFQGEKRTFIPIRIIQNLIHGYISIDIPRESKSNLYTEGMIEETNFFIENVYKTTPSKDLVEYIADVVINDDSVTEAVNNCIEKAYEEHLEEMRANEQ